MQVFNFLRQFNRLSKSGSLELSVPERDRLRALCLWQETGDLALACRTFALSRAALYRWRRRFNPHDLSSLKEHSRRPRRLRKPKWPLPLMKAVRDLRERYPRWGKDKLVHLLKAQGFSTSTSTVGRILTHLKTHGQLAPGPAKTVFSRKRRCARPYAIRKPKEYVPLRPGDLVQLDTLDIRPLPGVVLKQFTARDVVSRWDVLQAHSRATAQLAAQFILILKKRMPFPIRAVQVDGGSEFYADFEEACRELGIHLFVLPPRSPKLNAAVERAQRTHTEEFYEVTECSWKVEELNEELIQWKRIYNTIRPHQSLDYKTPLQFLRHQGIISQDPSLSHM